MPNCHDSPYLESCALWVCAVAGLTHTDGDRANIVEQDVVCALVILPFGDEFAESVVEYLLVNDNFVRHGGRDGGDPP